jgi:hypothetical protein
MGPKTPRTPWEIEAWSGYMEKRGPESDGETLAFFAEYVGQHTKTAKTSGRGSKPSISTTTSARDASRQIERKKVCQLIRKVTVTLS